VRAVRLRWSKTLRSATGVEVVEIAVAPEA
jgi:hypothetical protein